ncbi:unnamed protein product [Caenorhabditis sp. 36 PRJEB53466]|nr:unnamed protein product [Caenorhabditis sp. 36 PRJEB53466]
MAGAPQDDRDVIKNVIGQIRDIYVDIIKLRNEDRAKYKEMCMKLDALEKDRSARTKKRRRLNKSKVKKSSQSKNSTPLVIRKESQSKEDNKKDQGTPKTLQNDEDGKQEKDKDE